MNLLELQREFGGWLRTNQAAPDTAGFAVYRHAYRAQLLSCLHDTFEKTRAWLGDDAFDTAAYEHIDNHAPSAWTLGAYGVDFDLTLARIYPDDPEVAELAWLDWTLRRAFDGPDAAAVDTSTLGTLDWDQAIFAFAPTLRTRTIQSNCAAIWSALAEGDTPPPAAILADPIVLRVWRQALNPRFFSMDPVEARCLQLAVAGHTFGELCADLAEQNLDANVAATVLRRWLGDELIVAVHEAATASGSPDFSN